MMTSRLLASVAAAFALGASPALAQHAGHGGHDTHAAAQDRASKASAAAGIAEGTVKDGVRVVEMSVTDNGFEPSKVKV